MRQVKQQLCKCDIEAGKLSRALEKIGIEGKYLHTELFIFKVFLILGKQIGK